MRDRTRGIRMGVLRSLGVLVAIAAPLALNVSPAAAQEDGVGFASVRGTFRAVINQPSTHLGEAQVSAITDCDETRNNTPPFYRPFYVRWEGRVFKRTSTIESTCESIVSTDPTHNVNGGFGTGVIDPDLPGAEAATVGWTFHNRPGSEEDRVAIRITTNTSTPVVIDLEKPLPLRGSPGGVWVFGQLPWPSCCEF